MLIRSVKYSNYRPFIDEKIFFKESVDGKNIILIKGENGCGKSEILLSFLWCLYGERDHIFKFDKIAGKQSTPFSLNDKLLDEVRTGKVGSATARVTLTVELDNKEYEITRSEKFVFRSGARAFSREMSLRLESKDENNKTEIEENMSVIDRFIERMIPMKIARSLFFDGERMSNLASNSNRSDEIAKMIDEVTNVNFFTRLDAHLNACKREFSNQSRKIVKNTNGKELGNRIVSLEKKIESFELDVSNEKVQIQLLEKENEEMLDRVRTINNKEKEVADLKEKRRHLNNLKNNSGSIRDRWNNTLSQFGYLSFLDKLFEDVDEVIDTIDIPTDLTTKTIEYLLSDENNGVCICGNPIGEIERDELLKLKGVLPPEYKPGLIKYKMRTLAQRRESALAEIDNQRTEEREVNGKISKLEENIKLLTDRVIDVNNDEIDFKAKFRLNSKNLQQKFSTLGTAERELRNSRADYERLLKEFNKYKNSEKDAKLIDDRMKLVADYIKLVKSLIAERRSKALNILNFYIKREFQKISGDTDKGVSLEIKNYKLFRYNEENPNKELPSSTGQMKVEALSFISAISKLAKSNIFDNEYGVKKEYPIIVDSPFGDISGGNLTNSAQRLNEFSHQTILLIADKQYTSIKQHIDENINQEIMILRNTDESVSHISQEEEYEQ